jgi:molybdenum cofactor cytidylyltransferase
MAAANIVGALLVAGAGSRFGGHKGEAMLGGKMMAEHGAKSLAELNLAATYAVCNPDHAALCMTLEVLGLRLIANRAVDTGLSHSLGLAAQMAMQMHSDALVICLGDMPFVTSTHLGSLVRVFDAAGGARAVTSMAGDVRMPPAIFPKSLFPALAKLSGDSGAREFLQNALVVATDADMLADIDTPQDLADAEMRMLRAR